MSRDREPDPAVAPARETVRCPTCRAVQEWSDTCRRCKSDLRLLRAFAAAYHDSRRTCLEQLRSGPALAALPAARRCHALGADPESRRLLALAAFRAGDWATAAALASRIVDES
jgi:hypothetical protein